VCLWIGVIKCYTAVNECHLGSRPSNAVKEKKIIQDTENFKKILKKNIYDIINE